MSMEPLTIIAIIFAWGWILVVGISTIITEWENGE